MYIWIFNGAGGRFPSGVFSRRETAEAWIAEHVLTGILTAYPLDEGVYEWAVKNGFFRPKQTVEPGFIARFSSAYQEHYHYEAGVLVGE